MDLSGRPRDPLEWQGWLYRHRRRAEALQIPSRLDLAPYSLPRSRRASVLAEQLVALGAHGAASAQPAD
jgi:hypothetical protein